MGYKDENENNNEKIEDFEEDLDFIEIDLTRMIYAGIKAGMYTYLVVIVFELILKFL